MGWVPLVHVLELEVGEGVASPGTCAWSVGGGWDWSRCKPLVWQAVRSLNTGLGKITMI